MMKPAIAEAIIVEGRYDKNAVSQAVDAVIIETRGFGVFSDKERMELIRRLAEKRGIIILTDGDGAGFIIRNHLKGSISKGLVKQAYIPDVLGKERRKRTPSKEGKLGVEGMDRQIIVDCLRRAGATFLGQDAQRERWRGITKTDFFDLGLTGTPDSREKRRELVRKTGLPERISANALLDAVNALYTLEELQKIMDCQTDPQTPEPPETI